MILVLALVGVSLTNNIIGCKASLLYEGGMKFSCYFCFLDRQMLVYYLLCSSFNP